MVKDRLSIKAEEVHKWWVTAYGFVTLSTTFTLCNSYYYYTRPYPAAATALLLAAVTCVVYLVMNTSKDSDNPLCISIGICCLGFNGLVALLAFTNYRWSDLYSPHRRAELLFNVVLYVINFVGILLHYKWEEVLEKPIVAPLGHNPKNGD